MEVNSSERQLPDPTDYYTYRKICGLSLNFVPSLNKTFINHWEVNPGLPIYVLTVMITSFLAFASIVVPSLKLKWYFVILLTVIFSLFLISYINTILEGPGYLPFYYPLKPNTEKDKQFDFLSGIVTNDSQLKIIDKKKLPKRVHYFKTAKRIVLRPDHYCDWVASFVGKKNYKLFYLFNFYGFIYIALFFISLIFVIKKDIDQNAFPLSHYILILYVAQALFFTMFTMAFLCGSTFEISKNITDFENLADIAVDWDNSSCLSNWEEIFGSISKWYTWPIPFGAFHNMDSYELVEWPQEIAEI
ncbi:DHHC zinc finger domain containing protein [Trichomonas vaginalis G3]|uniref:Palmitoyltransferase n=1 Tax=Trichomonas vaginalis (strain ATCC PRA-98 / G3) TaxID=412133 RepID=A2E925_TRIV3|nr:cysteine S-palmitoyltransferase protein [Trichomonas vaginalis G3]EAY10819.1 DHHC zinc finger domain containing protein [Trichomonas vaginalis G3]KAI5519907.1 cysteine S-palmitoyltransferase protein [Trichomonas vaginalis G3]|eukprot:XP_001323042.1 DHHC zinc finger domain containing protein [Trichomonas vaginalis G3]